MILVRHAESVWNHHFSRTRTDPGIPDPALTERGRQQAQALIQALEGQAIRRLIASPYRRALETAAVLGKALCLPVLVEPLVRERCVFSCDIGSAPEQLLALWPALDLAHLEPQWWGEPPESEASVATRGAAFREREAAHADCAATAVITHWGFIRGLTGQEVANASWLRLAD